MQFFHPKNYLKQATDAFILIKKKIKYALPTAKIEHIGSSAIFGALSKGDLDVFVGVSSEEEYRKNKGPFFENDKVFNSRSQSKMN